MKRIIVLTLASTLAGLLIILGCSNSTNSSNEGTQLNMDDFFGGYSPADEAPAFGDSEIGECFPVTETSDSDLNHFERLDSMQLEPDVSVYSMRIMWGMLEFDSTVTSLTNWSGSLSIDLGCIRVIDRILFEKNQDYFVRPRLNCQTLEWVSYTSTHFDGIHVFLYLRNRDVNPDQIQLNLLAGGYSRTFSLAELDSLFEIVDFDELGNKVVIEAQKLERLQCSEGYLEGRWIRLGNGRFDGQFFGRFISTEGIFLGHVKGHWGERDQDENLFFGKWINEFGAFKGFLRGTWGSDASSDDYQNGGWFDGNYYDENQNILGTLKGNWVSHHKGSMPNSGATDKVPKHARGFFHGSWKQYCN